MIKLVLQNTQKVQEKQKHQYDAKHNSRTTMKVEDEVIVQEKEIKRRNGGKA